MNARSRSRFRKGSVLNTKNTASSVSMVLAAAFLPRFFAVRSAVEVGPLAAQQGSALFGFRLLGRNATQPRLPNLLSRFWRTNVVTPIGMLSGMIFGGQAFKVFRPVVRFIAVDVVNMLVGVKRLQPASCHGPVHKAASTQHKITPVVLGGGVRLELSENFSAARNGVKVVKESVLDSVHFYAQHAVPFKVAKES